MVAHYFKTSDIEGNQPTSGTSGSRDLRDRPRVNYAELHSYGTSKQQDIQTGAVGGFHGAEGRHLSMGMTHGNIGMQPTEDEISDLDPSSQNNEQMTREMENIDREMKFLVDQEALLTKSQQLREKRLALEEQRKKVTKLRGMNSNSENFKHRTVTKTSKNAKQQSDVRSKTNVRIRSSTGVKSCIEEDTSSDSDYVTINSLRKNDKNDKLRKTVRKELKSLGLHCEDLSSASVSVDTSSDSSSSSNSDASDNDSSSKHKARKSKKHKSKKNKKSGIKAKSSDKVKSPQKWPHAYLQFEYVNKQVKFEELDYRMFIAGELEVISESDISKEERNGRISLLKKIVYYSGTYDFKGLKAFYAAWLREIELGKKSWSDDPQQIETPILTKHIRLQKTSQPVSKKDSGKQTADKEKVWFCSMYQRNKCSHKNGHIAVFKGEARFCQHICATCWLKDKTKLPHPECSSSCPHASA